MSQTYAVVTTDGREHPAVDLETIKKWYLQSQLNDNSLVFSLEAGDWKQLGRMFDPRPWTGNYRAVDDSDDYSSAFTTLAVPPDADYRTVHHEAQRPLRTKLHAETKKPVPGRTALATLAFFAIFGGLTYIVLVNFVFYEETISFSNVNEVAALKTHVIKGKPFTDKSGAKVNFATGWNMVNADMPEAKVQAPQASMFAVNFDKKMFSALEVVPLNSYKGDLKQKMSQILNGYRAKSVGPFAVISDQDTSVGQYPARKSIFSRRDKSIDTNTTTHMLIAQDKYNLYIFQVWSVSDKYASLLADFDQTEKALVLP
jgi:hypothetical protein